MRLADGSESRIYLKRRRGKLCRSYGDDDDDEEITCVDYFTNKGCVSYFYYFSHVMCFSVGGAIALRPGLYFLLTISTIRLGAVGCKGGIRFLCLCH